MSTMMQKVAEVAPDTYQFLIDTSPAIRTSPFAEEILEEMDGIIKHAESIGSPLRRISGDLGKQLAVNVGGGIAMALAGDMYAAVKRGLTKSRYYRNMLDENPDLKKMPARDVQNAFNILHQYSPEYASNATVAGSFVRQQAQFPQFDTKQLGELVGANKNITDTKKLPSGRFDLPRSSDPREDEMKSLQLMKARGDVSAQAARDAPLLGTVGQAARTKAKRLGA